MTGSADDASALNLIGISVAFDGVHALQDVDLTVRVGETVGLIGPNGAGKSTLLNIATGFLKPDSGEVLLDSVAITAHGPEWRARAGVVRSFQAVRPFGDLTVHQNVEVSALACGANRKDARGTTAMLLDDFGLADRANALAKTLPAGDQRRLGVLRALASHPSIVLLDEPAAGLDEDETHELVEFIKGVSQAYNIGLLIIEHDMAVIMRLCQRIHVLNFGRTLARGTPEEIKTNDEVLRAYLGSGAIQ
jgi:branched-chain amino acid transport system ATP-binding protein